MEDKQKTQILIPDPKEPGLEQNIAIEEDTQKATDKKKKSIKFTFLLLAFLLLIGIGSGSSVLGYLTYEALYHKDMPLAQAGIQHLRNATTLLEALPKKSLDPAIITHAQQEFSSASTAFTQVNASLASLPPGSTLIPVYGSRLSAALHLLPLAIEVSQAGIAGCTILNTLISRFHDPLNARNPGLTMADITLIANNLRLVKTIFDQAVDQVNRLQPNDVQFDPRLDKAITAFHAYLPTLHSWVNDAEGLISVAPSLLGVQTPAHYLIEVLDTSELRPAGGFIGNFGIATFTGGSLVDAHITDVYLFDQAFRNTGRTLAYPAAYKWFSRYLAPASWSFRDSNLDADFPTTAQNSELNYLREGGNVPLQGVIAITPALIQNMLTLTGPIYVPEYHETVTAQNLVDRIHYHQLGPGREGNDVPASDGHSSVRKHFTELLAEHFLMRIHQLPSSTLPAILQVMINALHSKDIQVYLNSSVAEGILQGLHLASSIQPSSPDNLFVVNTNVSPNKANSLITNTLDDQVTLDADGNAIHHTTIRYVWGIAGNVYGTYIYRDYMQVYMPPGSIVSLQHGWQPDSTSTAFGRQVLSGSFKFTYPQTITINLVWTVPHAAKKDAHGWHYQYEIQRQAGAKWNVRLAINPPTCATIKTTSAGLVTSNKQTATLSQALNEDLLVSMDYTCS